MERKVEWDGEWSGVENKPRELTWVLPWSQLLPRWQPYRYSIVVVVLLLSYLMCYLLDQVYTDFFTLLIVKEKAYISPYIFTLGTL